MTSPKAYLLRRIEHRPNLIKAAINVGWLLFDRVIRMGVGLFVGVWVARYLGPERFGLLSFATAFVGLFGPVAILGLQGVVVRDIVHDPESANVTIGTAAALQFVSGLLTFGLLVGAISWLRPDDDFARLLVGIIGATVLFKFSDVVIYWYEAQVQSKYSVWVQNGAFVIFAAVKIFLISIEAPLEAFAWAILAEAAFVAVFLFIVLSARSININALLVRWNRAATLISDAWPLMLSGLAVVMYMKIDQIMLGQLSGNEAVGLYSAAVRLSEIWYFVPMAIVASLTPTLLRDKKANEPRYRGRLQKLFDLLALISLAVALPMTFFAEPLVTALYGSAYGQAGHVLAVHIWGSFFVFMGVASSHWFLSEGLQMMALQRTLIGAALNVVLNFLAIPLYSGLGAACASIASFAAAGLVFDVLQSRTRPMFRMKIASLGVIGPIIRITRKIT